MKRTPARRALEASGLTVADVARRMDCSQETVNRMLRGGVRATFDRAEMGARILGCSMTVFLAGDDTRNVREPRPVSAGRGSERNRR